MALFDGKKPRPDQLPLRPEGSDFRQEVWKILCRIPYGELTTYKDISLQMAEKLGVETMSAQAVGGAVSHNPISVIIPCHRVVARRRKSDGLCRRHRYQDKTSEARRRRYDRTFYTEEGNSPVDHAGRNLVDKSNVIYYTLVYVSGG